VTGRRLLAAVAVIEAVVFVAIAAVALDLRAHYHVEDLGGVNVWGYRGPVMPRKQPNEIRIAMVGGDLAFGWGVAATETLPYFVRRLVALDFANNRVAISSTAVNLSARGLDPSEYADWLSRFAYLQPDVVFVLPDPPAHPTGGDRFLPDRHSWFFTRLGYSPILPLVVAEKSEAIGSPLLRTAAHVLERIDVQSDRSRAAPRPDPVGRVIAAARAMAPIGVVLIVVPGAAGPTPATFADPRIRTVDLRDAPAMQDMTLRFDGFSFSAGGHSAAADLVAPTVIDLLHAARRIG
jgi:hypothetical protein